MQFPAIKDIIKQSNSEKYSKYLALMPDLRQEKTKKFTTIVLTLAASIILGLFAVNPTLSTVANLQKQIDELKADLATMSANQNVQNPFSNKGTAQKD